MTDDQAELEQLELEQMAEFCLATGFPPAVYWDLTVDEYGAFVTAYNKRNKEGA